MTRKRIDHPAALADSTTGEDGCGGGWNWLGRLCEFFSGDSLFSSADRRLIFIAFGCVIGAACER